MEKTIKQEMEEIKAFIKANKNTSVSTTHTFTAARFYALFPALQKAFKKFTVDVNGANVSVKIPNYQNI